MLALLTVSLLVLQPAAGEAAAHCSLSNGMTDEIRQMFVDKHNEIRSIIARGLGKNKLGGFAPKAANMLKVSYDCEVEENMMEWARQCKWAHSSYKARKGWGQNLYAVDARNLNKTRMAKQSVEAWFSELANRGVPRDNKLSWKVFAKGVGHYSQVAWHNSNKIGCAVQWCEKMTFVGCEYKPTGNYLGAPIYEVGEPCSKCNCEGCKCDKEEGLCITPAYPTDDKNDHGRHHEDHRERNDKKANEEHHEDREERNYKKAHEKHHEDHKERNDKKAHEKHDDDHKERNDKKAHEKHDDEQKEMPTKKPATHCSLNNGMTDEIRQMFVDKHNEIRSIIAKGLAKNKLGGFAPKAANMLKVSYDCEVEENMMEWARQCKWAHSSYKARKGWGQNLYAVDARNLNKTRMAKQSVEAWFSELANRGVPQDNKLSWKVFAKGVGHYSQVAWHNSNKIGCAVQWCEKMTFVGCEYKPTGNYLGAPIYEVGEPCSKCNCEGCKCDKEEGLCVAP